MVPFMFYAAELATFCFIAVFIKITQELFSIYLLDILFLS